MLLEKALQKQLFSDNPLNINTKNDKLFALKSTETNCEILYILYVDFYFSSWNFDHESTRIKCEHTNEFSFSC